MARRNITTGRVPQVTSITVSPTVGAAWETLFSLAAGAVSNLDGVAQFSFFYLEPSTQQQVVVGVTNGTAVLSGVRLPAGDVSSPQCSLRVGVDVYSQYLAR